MAGLTLHQLAPSPNSIKVRLALAWKGLEYARVDVNPMDRSAVLALSGQPLTPVLEHDGRFVYDSYAILRYLDANWRSGRRLFDADDRDRMHAIEDWELFARLQLGEVIGLVFGQFFAPAPEAAALARANELLAQRVARIEETLADREYLMGAAPNAADLTCAPFVSYGLLDPAREGESGIRAFFARHLHLPGGLERTRAWVGRVMAIEAAA